MYSTKINSILQQPKWNPPGEVNEYSFEGEVVYLFTSNCCDQYDSLYSKDCNFICAPSGGFTAKGDGKCVGFSKEARHIRLIWKDAR